MMEIEAEEYGDMVVMRETPEEARALDESLGFTTEKVRFTKELYKDLRMIAARKKIGLHPLIRQALREFVGREKQ